MPLNKSAPWGRSSPVPAPADGFDQVLGVPLRAMAAASAAPSINDVALAVTAIDPNAAIAAVADALAPLAALAGLETLLRAAVPAAQAADEERNQQLRKIADALEPLGRIHADLHHLLELLDTWPRPSKPPRPRGS